MKALLFLLALCIPCSAQIYPWPSHGAVVYPGITADVIVGTSNPSSPGTALTQAIANSSTSCGSACTVSTGGGATQLTWAASVYTGFTVGSPQSACSNLGPVTLLGGSTYAAGTLVNDTFQFAGTSTYTQAYMAMPYGIAPASVTVGGCISLPALTVTGGGLVDPGYALFAIPGDYSMVQLGKPSSTMVIRLEAGPHVVLRSAGYALVLPGSYLISNNYTPARGSLYSGTYTTGGTITGTTGQTCNLAFIGGGGTGATATVALTGTNTIASGTAVSMTPTGQSGYTSTSTTAALSAGTATACTGTATVTTVLGGLATLSVHNASTGALLDQETLINYPSTTIQKVGGEGNNEGTAYAGLNTLFGWTAVQFTSPQTDLFGSWHQ